MEAVRNILSVRTIVMCLYDIYACFDKSEDLPSYDVTLGVSLVVQYESPVLEKRARMNGTRHPYAIVRHQSQNVEMATQGAAVIMSSVRFHKIHW